MNLAECYLIILAFLVLIGILDMIWIWRTLLDALVYFKSNLDNLKITLLRPPTTQL